MWKKKNPSTCHNPTVIDNNISVRRRTNAGVTDVEHIIMTSTDNDDEKL